jgi:translation elongation factor EF-Tu-like GTPase
MKRAKVGPCGWSGSGQDPLRSIGRRNSRENSVEKESGEKQSTRNDRSFRMTIHDVFAIRGRGTVVTGRIERGTVRVGDGVQISRQNGTLKTVVRAVEMFHKQVDGAGAGDHVGIFLRTVEKGDVQRGDQLMGATPDLNLG